MHDNILNYKTMNHSSRKPCVCLTVLRAWFEAGEPEPHRDVAHLFFLFQALQLIYNKMYRKILALYTRWVG
jgi:hypothetical protein